MRFIFIAVTNFRVCVFVIVFIICSARTMCNHRGKIRAKANSLNIISRRQNDNDDDEDEQDSVEKTLHNEMIESRNS